MLCRSPSTRQHDITTEYHGYTLTFAPDRMEAGRPFVHRKCYWYVITVINI